MAGLGTLAVYLTAKTTDFNSGIDAAMRKIMKFSSLTPATMGIAAGAVVGFATKSLMAFSESEKVVNKFNATLREQKESVLRYSKPLQDLAGKLQGLTTFDDEAILSTMALGLNMGISANKMDEAIKAAIGLTSRGMSLESAMTLIGKAANGNFKALSKMGIEIDKNLSPHEKFNKLLEIGASKFSIVTAEADSLSGRWTQMMNAIGDLWEAFGAFFNELFDFKGIMSDVSGTINIFSEYIKANAFEWAYVLKSVWIEFKYAFLQAINFISPLTSFIGDYFMALVQIVKAAGNNIVAVFEWIYENAGKIWGGMWEIVKAWAMDIGSLYKNIGEQIWNTLTMKDADWASVAANLGKNLGNAMRDLKISGLELDTSGLDAAFSAFENIPGNISKVGDEMDRIEEERMAAQESLFNNERDRKMKEIDKTYDQSKSDLTKPKKDAQGMDLRKEKNQLSSAMERGSVEAYSAIAKSGGKVQDEIQKNTKESVAEAKKHTQYFTQIVDAFGVEVARI